MNISLGDAVNQVSGNSTHEYFPVARGTLSHKFFTVIQGIRYVTQIDNVCDSCATCKGVVFVVLRTLFSRTGLLINLLLYFATCNCC